MANADNNVQKASETLLTMGYDKKDTSIQKHALKKKEEENARKVIAEKFAQEQPPKIKSFEEKNKCMTIGFFLMCWSQIGYGKGFFLYNFQ